MRASCCVSVLPPSTVPGARTFRTIARAERDRIDAGMQEEAVILDGDERVLQVTARSRAIGTSWRCSSRRNQRLAVGGVEPGVADAARQLVDGVALLGEPADADAGHDDEQVEQQPGPAHVGAQQTHHGPNGFRIPSTQCCRECMRRKARPFVEQRCRRSLVQHLVDEGDGNRPFPTADATRLTLPPRTSPTANTPGRLVSSRCGGRASGQRAAARSSGDKIRSRS